ncbi:uncharacterized protein PODANS_3_5960 [Podospora anserina S mat+]|uniref:Podospora anserina S mat+ genomic DNA chromosome 3, supercontig 2 n=1 Tax=Podospora anserina (strain S / ATCC MYA-4624 / DSM 980 / FGSC 10383) TaxID=515849 RepID=B2B0J2_PODAN|nr:uncharacterized protein PODANS_3_5960 [Podospora anserina S mat+]CAP70530.1 unnamed protein product [Podospora anserina S mat+]CDP27117.1 Putative protein of unknown function [Podospora anserina S mat+]
MSAQKYDDSRFTRRACVTGLVLCWFVAVGSIIGGGLCLYKEVRDDDSIRIDLSNRWRELLPLGLNIFITLLNDSMGYIHAVALRWSLIREGSLDFNSNLRLLTFSKKSPPNGYIPNFLYLFGIILAYGATSVIFLSLNPELARLLGKSYEITDTRGVHLNGIALIILGCGFLLQAAVTNWALAGTKIPTWSSNPLIIANTCMNHDTEHYQVMPRQGRCMMGVHLAGNDIKAIRPTRKQRPMITAHPHVRRVLYLLWALPILSGVWGGGVYGYLLRGSKNGIFGRSWSLLPEFPPHIDENCHTKQCTDGTSVLNLGWSTSGGAAGTTGGVFLIIAIQSVVTLSLHCAELIVNLSRDEGIYRKLIGPRGTNGHFNSVVEAFTSWQTIFLFTLKSGVHWMFGLAINLQFQLGVNMYPSQIFYFGGLTLVAALFGLLLSLQRPSGYLPPTYGHIQTIADIIDEWADSGCMFWGEKGPHYTGTSTKRLKQPDPNVEYGGMKKGDGQGSHSDDITEIPLETFSPASLVASPPMDQSFGYVSPVVQTPPSANAAWGQPWQQQQGQFTYAQWTNQDPRHQYQHSQQHQTSYDSLNSRFSGQTGYSGYSNQSTQPFLHNYRSY